MASLTSFCVFSSAASASAALHAAWTAVNDGRARDRYEEELHTVHQRYAAVTAYLSSRQFSQEVHPWDTDIEGANAAGMPSLHVLTGVSGHIALLEAPKEQRPTYIAEDMRALNEDPAILRPGAQGGFTARVDGNDILLERGYPESTSIEALRTVLEVAWSMKRPADLIRPISEDAARVVANWW